MPLSVPETPSYQVSTLGRFLPLRGGFSGAARSAALIQRLEGESDEQRFGDLAGVLLDQARLAEGQQLEDPGSYAQRVNRLLLELSA